MKVTLLVCPRDVTITGARPTPAILAGSVMLICCSPAYPGASPNHITSAGIPPIITEGLVNGSRPVT